MKALLLLHYLQTKALVRRLLGNAPTIKGAIVAFIMLGLGGLMLVPVLVAVFAAGDSERLVSFPIERYAPFVLFAYFIATLLTSFGERAIYFTPSEIDNLFSAPFSRRQLLIYKMSAWIVVSVLVALALTCGFAGLMYVVPFGFIGLILTLFAMTIGDMLLTLIGQTISLQLYSGVRKWIALICLVGFALAISEGFSRVGVASLADAHQAFDAVSRSEVGRILLAPFSVFTNMIFARTAGDFVVWGGGAMAITLAMISIIMALDANYLESATAVSERVYEHAQRMVKGQARISAKSTGWRLPMFPFLRGFGPIAWRQIMTSVRQAKWVIVMTIIAALAFCVPMFFRLHDHFESKGMVYFVFGVLCYVTFIFSMSLPMGFRADIDHIEVFKALPLRPTAVAAGELVGALTVIIGAQLFIVIMSILASGKFLLWWIVGLLFIVPFDVLQISAVSAIFLIYPVRHGTGAKGIEQFGQGILCLLLYGAVLVVVGGICFIPSALTYLLTDNGAASMAVAWLMLVSCAAVSVLMTGRFYGQFDVAKIPAA